MMIYYAQQADLLYRLNINLMKWHRSYWHVSQYEVTLPKWQSGQGVGLVTWRSWVQSPAEPYFLFFIFFSFWTNWRGTTEHMDISSNFWLVGVRTICGHNMSVSGIVWINFDHFKRYFPKIYFIRKILEVWKFFFSMLKKFFFQFFFLNSCVNLQVRPKINGFYQERKFSLG